MLHQADYHLLLHFLCVDFLPCIALKYIWPHYLGMFSTQYYAPETEQDQIDTKWLGKKLISQ